MRLKVLGSNSTGNCYILEGRNDALIIELGVSVSKIKKAMNFNMEKVVGAIVTHSHGDHAKYMGEMMNQGVNVYASEDTLKAKRLDSHHRATVINPKKKLTIGSFNVWSYEVQHDVPCLMFIIEHEECGMTLFLTDTMYCKYKLPKLNNIIVECNHDLEVMANSNTPSFLRERIVNSHMNLDTCKELLLATDLKDVFKIVLIHLSNSNSDASKVSKEIAEATGKEVHIAEAGLIIEDFNKSPF